MKRIAVIGLGIIGGSVASALKRAGYAVDGYARSTETTTRAKQLGYVDGVVTDLEKYDFVVLALPPKVTLSYLTEKTFQDDAVVVDICGVKRVLEDAVYAKKRNYRYVGLHPMAGKETSGLASASTDLFQGANLIICRNEHTDKEALKKVYEFSSALGFGRVVECSAKEHDEKIALTSQLAHLVSNAYVKSDKACVSEGFTGGSFQDMTRIAGVDERMWTPLYMLNADNVLSELSGLIEHLTEYKNAIEQGDEIALSNALREGREIRQKCIKLPKRK